MALEQACTVMITGKADELVTQLQFSTGGMVSTTVTVWLHWSWLVQSSIACQVRVMTMGQVPFVTVLTTVTTTPLLGVPGGGEQLFVQVGGLKDQFVPHCTVLFVAQIRVNVHPGPGDTTKGTKHWVEVPKISWTVKVI